MEKVSQTPHDAVFRQMLMHHAVAKDFMQLYLPAPFLAICELDSLQLVSGSFVEEDLRASYSDILYSLRTRHGPGYVYALIEHPVSYTHLADIAHLRLGEGAAIGTVADLRHLSLIHIFIATVSVAPPWK